MLQFQSNYFILPNDNEKAHKAHRKSKRDFNEITSQHHVNFLYKNCENVLYASVGI